MIPYDIRSRDNSETDDAMRLSQRNKAPNHCTSRTIHVCSTWENKAPRALSLTSTTSQIQYTHSIYSHYSCCYHNTSPNCVHGTELPRSCARRLRKEQKARSFRQDPYILAHCYSDYMKKHPIRQGLGDKQTLNQYYEKLLANQPEPDPDATDDRLRAIRYAKRALRVLL